MIDRPPTAARTADKVASPDQTLTIEEMALAPQWRLFSGPEALRPGLARATAAGLMWSVSPGQWTLLGPRPGGDEVVELTHVRAVFRLTGTAVAQLLNRMCSLDLSDDMFPAGAAARTLVAGVATEIVRVDVAGVPSYLVIPSRSFGAYLHGTILDAAGEFGIG